ncbi:MAG: glycosyltransferase family 39 protein [Lewinellaceae bacterium]|nr:glycosyltransferase family 39 protein [Lewinellaceae bacterium]
MSKKKLAKPVPQHRNQPIVKRPASKIQRPTSNIKGALWVGLAASILGFLLYANTLGHQYTLDDFSIIKSNWITKGGLKNIGLIFSTEYRFGSWNSVGSLYRPIPLTMFTLEWQLSPDNPMLGHVLNALFYALTGWVLWTTWRRVLVDHPPVLAAIAVLVFMAHPVHTEVVANIKSRDEILALLFGTLTLRAIWEYIEKEDIKWLLVAALTYAIAMFSKESAITLMAVFPLAMWFFSSSSVGKIARVAGVLLVPAVIFLLIRKSILDAQPYQESYSILDNFMAETKNQGERLASAFMMCGRYLWVLIFPHPLVSDMGYPQTKVVTFADWRALAGFFVYVGMGIWAVMNLSKKHILSFAILFYLATFSVFSNVLMQIGTSYGERLLYIPSFGFALAVGWLFCKIFKINDLTEIWNPNGKGTALWMAVGVLLGIYALKTVIRNGAWYDSASLYAADLINSPNCAKLNYHNALEQVRIGMDEKESMVKDVEQVKKGIAGYDKCIQLYPQYHDAYGSRGLAYFRLGEVLKNPEDQRAAWDKALSDYQESLKYRYNNSEVLSNMGKIYFTRNQPEKAEEVYRKSVEFDPRFVDGRRNLGAVLAMQRKFPQAIEQWKEALKYADNTKSGTLYFYIGSAYKDMGQPENSVEWFEKAYAVDPSLRK